MSVSMPTDSSEGETEKPGPCPFCGGTLVSVVADKKGKYMASCEGCYCIVGKGYDKHGEADNVFTSRQRAVRAWNARADIHTELERERDALRSALQKILDYDDECGCQHDNENCCELNKVFCPRCIAAVALRGNK